MRQDRVSMRALSSVESGCSGGPSPRNIPSRTWRIPAPRPGRCWTADAVGRTGASQHGRGRRSGPSARRRRGVGVPLFTSDFPALAARSS